jgi:hypothetical protein
MKMAEDTNSKREKRSEILWLIRRKRQAGQKIEYENNLFPPIFFIFPFSLFSRSFLRCSPPSFQLLYILHIYGIFIQANNYKQRFSYFMREFIIKKEQYSKGCRFQTNEPGSLCFALLGAVPFSGREEALENQYQHFPHLA